MQFSQCDSVDVPAAAPVAAKIVRCDQCQATLGDKAVLTRDALKIIRRFCPDNDCVATWRQTHRVIFGNG